jgi:hypothetical protein
MLIRTILAMFTISNERANNGESLTRNDAPLGGCLFYESTALKAHANRAVGRRSSSSPGGLALMPNERACEAQVLLRLQKVWLDAERLFVVSNG